MNRSHAWLITAGALVLALTNAVVLVGVASNRRQPPDSVFELSERELGPQWNWMWREGENSGLSLRLEYRIESARNPGSAPAGGEQTFSSGGNFGPVAWLDRDKLSTLGFDLVAAPALATSHDRYVRMLGRDVLLVLELDGPVRARALESARNLLARRERANAAVPQREEISQQLKDAQQALKSEEQEASRLFIVDAGLEQADLRQRYADRTHYAIVHGNIRPFVMTDGTTARLYGAVTAVRCESIDVPLQFQANVPMPRATDRMAMNMARADRRLPFTVRVAFGRHLEPWIESAHAGPT